MEDYIFLIIAVVISIFAAINKSKKKQQANNTPVVEEDEVPRNFFMDQLLGEDFLEESEEEVRPMVMTPPVTWKEPLIVRQELRKPEVYQQKFKSTLPDRQKRGFQSVLKKSNGEDLEVLNEVDESPGIMDDFSLRKAIIYSEILNPKY